MAHLNQCWNNLSSYPYHTRVTHAITTSVGQKHTQFGWKGGGQFCLQSNTDLVLPHTEYSECREGTLRRVAERNPKNMTSRVRALLFLWRKSVKGEGNEAASCLTGERERGKLSSLCSSLGVNFWLYFRGQQACTVCVWGLFCVSEEEIHGVQHTIHTQFCIHHRFCLWGKEHTDRFWSTPSLFPHFG